MSEVPVSLIFSDGGACTLSGHEGDNLVDVAAQQGYALLTDCLEGHCGTCAAQLIFGDVALDNYDEQTLTRQEREQGAILPCVARLKGACAVEFPYPISEASGVEPPQTAHIADVDPVAEDTYRLVIDVDAPFDFLPGQYVKLRPKGSSFARSYSMANAPGQSQLTFFIRIVHEGQFSNWLIHEAKPGVQIEVSRPHGSFFLRQEPRNRLFVAGGTGLAPFLSMLEASSQDNADPTLRTDFLIGARTSDHIFAVHEIKALATRMPNLNARVFVEERERDGFEQGRVTDALTTLSLNSDTRVYLCGPPPMVDAARRAIAHAGICENNILCERFA